MKVTETVNEGLARELRIVVEASELEKKMDARLQSYGANAKIAGFRPGKVPLEVLRQRYGQSVAEEVVEETLRTSSKQALDDKGLRPVMPPKAQLVSFSQGQNLEFKVNFEVFPEIQELDFAKISLERMEVEVPESEIKQAIQRLLEANRKLKKVEDAAHKVANGDVVAFDFKGTVDGNLIPGGSAEKYMLEIGSKQFIPGFEEELVGLKADEEKTFKINFPKDYAQKDLAGKEAEFWVKVREVHTLEVPEASDDFAKSVGAESLDKLKEIIGQQLEGDFKGIARMKLKRELFDYLEKNLKFEVPKTMYEIEKASIMRKLETAKKQGDPSVKGKSDAELEKEYSKIAERRVMLGLFLSETGRKNDVQVSEMELRTAMISQARQFPGQEKKVFDFYRQNPQFLEDLKGPIYEDKTVDFILEKAKISGKKASLDDLMKFYNGEDGAAKLDLDNIPEEHVHDENCDHDHDHNHDEKTENKPAKKTQSKKKAASE